MSTDHASGNSASSSPSREALSVDAARGETVSSASYVFPRLGGKRLHLGVCGGVAAYKTLDLMRMWIKAGIETTVVLTAAAVRFVTPLSFVSLGALTVRQEMFQIDREPFGHLDPAHEADAFVIAPATANILAKIAHGLADDMLSCQALAYPRPLCLAPAMNPAMWRSEALRHNISLLRERGHEVIAPGSGRMACGDQGEGRLPEIERLYLHGLRALAPRNLAGKRVLVTLGPTREYFDPVRFWSNPSTGRMGAALAVAAWLRGARVDVVAGPTTIYLPPEIAIHRVTSAREMSEKCLALWGACDYGAFTAAVADYAPTPQGREKFKKSGADVLTVEFSSNPDILAHCGANKKSGQRILAFAAETSDLETAARDKLRRKNADLIAANLVGVAHSGFGSNRNDMIVCDAHGARDNWNGVDKHDAAWRLWDWLLAT